MQNAECRIQNEEETFLNSSFCVLHSFSLTSYLEPRTFHVDEMKFEVRVRMKR
jgi:hypothetical protein